jgi:hypothetical protein
MVEEIARPVYKHIIVKRKGSMTLAASPERLKVARRQAQEVADGTRLPEDVDPDLQHLIKRDHLRKTMKKVYGEGYAGGQPRSQAGAIVVATLNRVKIPGGEEPLPKTATFWTHPASFNDMGSQDAFMEAALALQKRFQTLSDGKVVLLPDHLRKGVTVVTVAYTPIIAYPIDPRKGDSGFEVGMEFHQVTRFGRVDTDDFEVYAEDGVYPIQPPSDATMLSLMKSASELGDQQGFLSDEQRDVIKVETEANRGTRNGYGVTLPPIQDEVPPLGSD